MNILEQIALLAIFLVLIFAGLKEFFSKES